MKKIIISFGLLSIIAFAGCNEQTEQKSITPPVTEQTSQQTIESQSSSTQINSQQIIPADLITYKNNEFSFQTNRNWQIDPSRTKDDLFVFIDQNKGSGESRESIQFEKNSKNLSLDEAVKEFAKKREYTDQQINLNYPLEIGGEKTAQIKTNEFGITIYMFIHNGKIYTIESQNMFTDEVLKTFKFHEQNDLSAAVNELQNQSVPASNKQPSTAKQTKSQETKTTKLYRGSWFDIKYPASFIAAPTTPINSDGLNDGLSHIETDEATFTSPDKSVEFFVFSPLWSGDPIDYLSIKPTEEVVNEKTVTKGQGYEKSITHWVTVKAKDDSYYRSFVSIKNQADTESVVHHVFGIKYKTNEAYEKYKDDYTAFKKSLIQYGD